MGEVLGLEPVGERWEGALCDPERSSNEISSWRERGSNDCESFVGYNRFRIERHSSKDWESASRVLCLLALGTF